MPRTPRFEALSTELPLKVIKLNMFEFAQHCYAHIEKVLEYLDQNYEVVFEIPHEDKFIHVTKAKIGDFFVLEGNHEEGQDEKPQLMNPLELLNWLFEKAPYISMVGRSTKA